MLKAELMPNALSIGHSTLENTLPPYEQEFPSVKTAGDGNTLCLHVMLMVPSALSTTGHINSSIIRT